jgi:hypothetical protein
MQEYTTKYFGPFFVQVADEEIIIENEITINNRPYVVSIYISYTIVINDKVKDCIPILDDYYAINEVGKNGIIKNYNDKGKLYDFINDKLNISGNENRIKEIVEEIDPAGMVLEYKDKKIAILLNYQLGESDDFIVVELDEENKISYIKVFEGF